MLNKECKNVQYKNDALEKSINYNKAQNANQDLIPILHLVPDSSHCCIGCQYCVIDTGYLYEKNGCICKKRNTRILAYDAACPNFVPC